MTRREFIGVPNSGAGGEPPPPTAMGWEPYEALIEQYADRQAMRRLAGRNAGYELRRAADSHGRAILLVFDTTAQPERPVALIDDNLLVVDEGCRGRGLAEELILELAGDRAQPNAPREITGGSEKALGRAHELAVRRAHANLEDVPSQVLDEYQLTPLYKVSDQGDPGSD